MVFVEIYVAYVHRRENIQELEIQTAAQFHADANVNLALSIDNLIWLTLIAPHRESKVNVTKTKTRIV